MDQRLVEHYAGCAHHEKIGDTLHDGDVDLIGLPYDTIIRPIMGLDDLCNRTVISGRTLLLDAILITLGPSRRNSIYEALMKNVNEYPRRGVIVHTRREVD